MCIPGYWIAGFHGFHHPRKLQYPMGWGTLGFAFPAALGRRARRHRPDGLDLGRRRLPVRVRRARHDGAGAAPVHGGDRRRRRLRDAALRPGAGRRGDLRRRPARRPTSRRWPRASACAAETVEGLDDAFGEALARHVEDPAPSVLVARAEALVPPPTTSPNWYRKRVPAPASTSADAHANSLTRTPRLKWLTQCRHDARRAALETNSRRRPTTWSVCWKSSNLPLLRGVLGRVRRRRHARPLSSTRSGRMGMSAHSLSVISRSATMPGRGRRPSLAR